VTEFKWIYYIYYRLNRG